MEENYYKEKWNDQVEKYQLLEKRLDDCKLFRNWMIALVILLILILFIAGSGNTNTITNTGIDLNQCTDAILKVCGKS